MVSNQTEQHYEWAYEKFLELRGRQTYKEIERITGVSRKTISRWDHGGRRKRTYHNTKRLDQSILDEIKLMLDDGCSHEEIERTLHVSAKTIRKYFPGSAWTREQVIEFVTDVRRIKNTKRGINSQTLMRARKLFQEGYTIPEVARQVAVSDKTLRKYFPEYKMSREDSVQKAVANRIQTDPEKLAVAEELFERGYTIPEVSREVALSRDVLRKHFPEYKMSREESLRRASDARWRSQNS